MSPIPAHQPMAEPTPDARKLRDRSGFGVRMARAAVCSCWLGSCFWTATASANDDSAEVSDADKATARSAAKHGIQLYREQRHAEALVQLEKAQQLFDAPVHLLYIARCQRELGKLVEAGETYRALKLTRLDADAPRAFHDALSDAASELSELDGQIPKLVLHVAPSDAKLVIRIDDEVVPSAVLGLPRAMNPGSHRVDVSLTGYADASKGLELGPGENRELRFELEPRPTVKASVSGSAGMQDSEGTPESDQRAAPIGVMLGLRLGMAAAGGDAGFAFANPALDNQSTQLADYFGLGLGVELRGGLRFARYFTGVVFVSANAHSPGSALESDVEGETSTLAGEVEFESSGLLSTQLGLGLAVSSAGSDFGYWGEVDLGLQSMQIERSAVAQDCQLEVSASAPVARLFGGVRLGIDQRLQLTPYVGLSAGRFSSVETTTGGACADVLAATALPGGTLEVSGDQRKTFGMLHIGLGGDFSFGG